MVKCKKCNVYREKEEDQFEDCLKCWDAFCLDHVRECEECGEWYCYLHARNCKDCEECVCPSCRKENVHKENCPGY